MLIAVMPSVIILIVVMPSVIILIVVMPSVIMLIVVMPSVAALVKGLRSDGIIFSKCLEPITNDKYPQNVAPPHLNNLSLLFLAPKMKN
jgi:hypothetical protein